MTPASLTVLRSNLQATLGAAFGFQFVAGRVDPPVERGNLGCVWATGTDELGSNVSVEVAELRARAIYAGRTRSSSPRNPPDPTPLEDAADLFKTALAAVQRAEGGWYLRVTGVRIDDDLGVVEAVVRVWQDNVFKVL